MGNRSRAPSTPPRRSSSCVIQMGRACQAADVTRRALALGALDSGLHRRRCRLDRLRYDDIDSVPVVRKLRGIHARLDSLGYTLSFISTFVSNSAENYWIDLVLFAWFGIIILSSKWISSPLPKMYAGKSKSSESPFNVGY